MLLVLRSLWRMQVVSGGMLWLIEEQLGAARKVDSGQCPPALIAGWARDTDALGHQVSQRFFEVVAHEVELVLGGSFGGVHGDLGRRQFKDQPTSACVDPRECQH